MNYIVSPNNEFQINIKDLKIYVNGLQKDIEFYRVFEDEVHFIFEGQSFRARLISKEGGSAVIQLNGKDIGLLMKSSKQRILEKIGISEDSESQIVDLVAPMPGKILKLLKSKGEPISKSEGVLVLEAMKMENVLKSSCDAIISDIKVSVGDAVEKNQILITFE